MKYKTKDGAIVGVVEFGSLWAVATWSGTGMHHRLKRVPMSMDRREIEEELEELAESEGWEEICQE
jgi:hypothetical protein